MIDNPYCRVGERQCKWLATYQFFTVGHPPTDVCFGHGAYLRHIGFGYLKRKAPAYG